MEKQKVIVTDIQMPFWSMVVFMIKWTVASVPALIILSFLVGLVVVLIGALFSGLGFLPGLDGSV